jgi:CGNR zinc finger protein
MAAGQTLFGPSAVLERTAAVMNAAGPPARLKRASELVAPFEAALRAHGEPGALDGIADEAEALAELLAELYDLMPTSDPGAAAARLNAALAAHTGPLRLVEEPGAAWHLHAEPPGDESWTRWFAASSLLAMAVAFAERGEPAWGVCAAHDCIHVFVRTGPGRPRNACSTRCAARKRQTELRARRRARR